MRLSFQIVLVVLVGLGAIYAGVSNIYSPSNVFLNFYNVDINEFGNNVRSAIETQIRLLSGMWVAAGLVVILVAKKFESNTNVLRLVFLGLSLGAFGELLTAYLLGSNLQPVLVKTLFQISVCVGMEAWRAYIVMRTAPEVCSA